MGSEGLKVVKRPRKRPSRDANWTYAGQPARADETRKAGVGGLWRLAVLVILMPVLVMAGFRAYRRFPSLEAAKALVTGAINRELDVPTDMSHASLTITTNPPEGVAIFIDGRPVGKTPLDRLVIDMGPHEIRAEHPLYGKQLREIVAMRSQQLELSIDFEDR
jgi:hypothetical protein